MVLVLPSSLSFKEFKKDTLNQKYPHQVPLPGSPYPVDQPLGEILACPQGFRSDEKGNKTSKKGLQNT